MKPRTNLIFTAFNSVIWATAAIAMTVHANDASNCNLDSGLEESDDSYASAWTQQVYYLWHIGVFFIISLDFLIINDNNQKCNCAKAAAAFTWITCFSWLVTLVCSVIFFWHEKQLVQKNLKEHEMNKQATAQQMHPTEAEYQFGSASAAAAAVAGSGDEEQATAQQPLYVDRRTPSPPIAQKTEIPSEESPTPMQQNTYYHHSPTPPIHAVTGPSTYMPPHPHPEPQPYIHAITTASPPPPLYPPHHLQQQQHQQHVAAAPGPMYHMPQPSYYTTQWSWIYFLIPLLFFHYPSIRTYCILHTFSFSLYIQHCLFLFLCSSFSHNQE